MSNPTKLDIRPLPWFRFYGAILDDQTIQRLPSHLFRVWVNALCVASRYGGRLPPVADLAFALRQTEEQTAVDLAELVKAGLVSDEGVPRDWEEQQRESDLSTPRVQRFRARRKEISKMMKPSPLLLASKIARQAQA